MKSAVVFLLLGFLVSSCAFADTLYVGNAPGAGIESVIVYPDIQQAIDDCNEGDEVIVYPGTYMGEQNRNLNFNGKAITVRSLDPNNPAIVETTVIDCQNQARGFIFESGETEESILSGFTIINGDANFEDGGGIYCNNSGPSIKNCVIKNCSADDGGGIWIYGVAPQIEHCTIEDCTARYGGGIYANDCSPEIFDCTIKNNIAENEGGGIYAPDGITIENCRIILNRGWLWGGGVCTGFGEARNSLIAFNTAHGFGGGLFFEYMEIEGCTFSSNYAENGSTFSGTFATINHSIFWNNIPSAGPEMAFLEPESNDITYCCIQDEDPNDANVPYDPTNIDDDPLFVREPNDGGDGFGDDPVTAGIDESANDDYGDLHITKDSPCIDVGFSSWYSGSTDLDGQPRLMGGRVDMGVDEYSPVIAVIEPAGGEVFAAGSSGHEIRWKSFGVGQVDIELSEDGGDNWDTIESDVNNTGTLLWTLPGAIDSNECMIRVVPNIPDESVVIITSGIFTIKPYTPDSPVESVWRTLGKDFTRNALSDYNGPQLGCVKWVFDTNGPVSGSAVAGHDGRVYAACEDGNLYAIDSNGSELWKYQMGTRPAGSPTIGGDGTVYVGGEDGRLYAIDSNGVLRWKYEGRGQFSASSAVSDDGRIFAAGLDGKLYAMGADGSELWTFETAGFGSRTDGAIAGSPAVDSNGVVYTVGIYDPNIYALDANTGDIIWKSIIKNFEPYDGSIPGTILSPVIAPDGTIYILFNEDTNLYAVDSNDGSLKWSLNLADTESSWLGPEFSKWVNNYEVPGQKVRYGKWYGSECFSEPVVGHDGTIYVSFDDPLLRAVDPNGSIKWATRLGMVGGFTLSVGADGFIYAASDDSFLCVVDSNGTEIARFEGEGIVSSPVVAADNSLIVSDANNKLWAITTDDCPTDKRELHYRADIFSDGIVNFRDWAVFTQTWLKTTNKFLGYTIEGDTGWYYKGTRRLPDENNYYTGDEIYFPSDFDRNLYTDGFDLFEFKQSWFKDNGSTNKPPVVTIIKPKDEDWGVEEYTGEPEHWSIFRGVFIEVNSQDQDGQVVKVEFFVNEFKAGEDIDGSDGWTWQGDFPNYYQAGRYGPQWVSISAKATDNEGTTAQTFIQMCFYFLPD